MIHRYHFSKFGTGSILSRNSKVIGANNISIGNNVFISENGWLNANRENSSANPSLSIGDNTYIGRMCQINAWMDVDIGKNVLIADRVFISDADHQFKDKAKPIIEQGDKFIGSIKICDGSWLGIGCVILPGVIIGKNAIVAANSVVTKNVPDHSIASGVPAKIIKQL